MSHGLVNNKNKEVIKGKKNKNSASALGFNLIWAHAGKVYLIAALGLKYILKSV